MWTIILALTALTVPPCECGPGCGCVGGCDCCAAAAAAPSPALPGFTEARKLAERCHCDLVCYVGTEPPIGEQTRRATVYCRCAGIDLRPGSGVLSARWEHGQLGEWTWYRGRVTAAEATADLDRSAASPAESPANYTRSTPLMWYGSLGGCGGGGCGVGGCGPGGCGVGGFGRRR